MIKSVFTLSLFLVLCAVVCCVSPFFGVETIAPSEAWHSEIFWTFRVPRVLFGLLAGGCLAVAGMVFQSVFRNPLATPFTLGMASGAALGASIAILCSATSVPVTVAAFGGALLSLVLVFTIAKAAGGGETEMLLAGIAISFICSSVIMLVQYISDPTQTVRMLRWTMGGLDSGGSKAVLRLLPWTLPILVIIWFSSRSLDLFSTGAELAAARGLNTQRSRVVLLVLTSLMIAAVVSACGPIGFLGLMVPHIARRFVGVSHGVLFPAVFLTGATLLVFCDTLARCTIPPDEIPVGIFTALLGGPFFVGLLLFRRRS